VRGEAVAKTARHRRWGDTQSSLSDAGPLETGWARAATPARPPGRNWGPNGAKKGSARARNV